MKPLRVTVAMPVFNASEWVADAVESVLAQDFDGFELIVVDDGSTDGSCDRVRPYVRDPRVRLSRNDENLGSGVTRNRILEMARGSCLVPCDADDLLLPGALRHLSRFLDRHAEVGAVYGDILVLEAGPAGLEGPPKVVGRDANLVWDLYENVVNHGGSMMRTELMRQVGGYACGPVPDDRGLFLKLAETTRIRYLAGRLTYVWRRHPGSQSRRPQDPAALQRMIEQAVDRRRRGSTAGANGEGK